LAAGHNSFPAQSIELTGAVQRSNMHLALIEGCKRRDESEGRFTLSTVTAAVTRDNIWHVFCAVTKPLGKKVDARLMSYHDNPRSRQPVSTAERSKIDRPVVESTFDEFSSDLLSDGCIGIGIGSVHELTEVHLTRDKLIVILSKTPQKFLSILQSYGIRLCNDLDVISDDYHRTHFSAPHHKDVYARCCERLGAEEFNELNALFNPPENEEEDPDDFFTSTDSEEE
jgi:hypothetical protein